MNIFPETIIEIYDDEPIYNVHAAAQFRPCNVVYIGTRKLKSKRIKSNIISCLRSLSLDTKCFFYSTDMMSLDSVRSELETILENFGDCAIDITGGNEVALVAVGMLAKEREIPLFRYDRFTHSYKDIYNCPAADGVDSIPDFSVDAMLSMAGGVMKSHGHLSLDNLSAETEADIFKVWTIYKEHYRQWHKAVAYLQQISKNLEGDALRVNAPAVVYGTERISGADTAVMNKLRDAGIILNYQNDGKRISFDYKNPLMRSCLCDAGICLELYVFAAAKRAGIYSDVRISVVIDWDGDLDARINTINEIDVLVMSGFVPIFISCKSGSPNVTALNEIKTLASKFGGEYAKPVLVTMSDVRSRDKYLARRAEDMGVELIDREDLVGDKLSRKLYRLSRL